MTIKPDGTVAKDIALYFIEQAVGRATPAIIKKTIVQAKSLMQHGYTKEEIISVIDYILKIKKTNMYSLGYVSASINDILMEIKKIKAQEEVKQQKELIKEGLKSIKCEVIKDCSSTKRNRDKADRLGIKSRFGEKSISDLFERE